MSGPVFASVGPAGIVHHAKCWACITTQHPGGVHDWAGPDDIAHALANGRPSPAGQVCGCHCADGAPLDAEPDEPDIVEVRYANDPCDTCGELGACGYDAEGRAMIHVTDNQEDTDG